MCLGADKGCCPASEIHHSASCNTYAGSLLAHILQAWLVSCGRSPHCSQPSRMEQPVPAPANKAAADRHSHDTSHSSRDSSSSHTRDTSASGDHKQPFVWIPHPPTVALGSSPSSSSSTLAGSLSVLGHSSPQQQQQQQPQQQEQQQMPQQQQAHIQSQADVPVVGPEGWERPFVIGVAGGTGESLQLPAGHRLRQGCAINSSQASTGPGC